MTPVLVPLLMAFPTEVLRFEVVEFKPKAEHHFSMEAPQRCGNSKPVEMTARSIKCQFQKSGETEVTLNVCDDKKTFCKPVVAKLNVAAASSGEPVRVLKNQHLNSELKKMLVPGFMQGSPDEVHAQAKAKKQPVFVMISTDWCPPCNEAKEYLLSSEAFQKATKDWLKVYVDGDSLSAAEWGHKVPYRYFPSFVLLNRHMKEIGRYNGELRQAEFAAWAKAQSQYLEDPVAKLRERVLARKEGRLWRRMKDLFKKDTPVTRHLDEIRLLRWALDQPDAETVDKLLPGGSFPEIAPEILRYQIARIDEQEKPDKAKKVALIQDLVSANFRADDWAEAVEMLCDEDETACRSELSKVEERKKFLNSRAEITPAEKASMLGEEYFYLASIAGKLKDKSREKEFAGNCVSQYDTLKSLSQLKLARGAQQTLVYCLETAEKFKEAEKLLKSLVETYPSEPTFMVRLARSYRKQKKLDQALVWLEKAGAVAYGYNWYSAEILKSDVLLDLKRDQDAMKVVQDALKEVRISEDRSDRNQTLVARLRAQQTKIQARLEK